MFPQQNYWLAFPIQTKQASLLIVSASETDANMLYATGFFAPDPFIFFAAGG
jgi:hypothetical protein